MEFRISARTKLRDDFDADGLRLLAKASKDAAQTRRLLTLASIYDGGSHFEAARIGGVGPQIARVIMMLPRAVSVGMTAIVWH